MGVAERGSRIIEARGCHVPSPSRATASKHPQRVPVGQEDAYMGAPSGFEAS